MKIDYYGLRNRVPQRGNTDPRSGLTYARCTIETEPDLEHEMPAIEAVARAKCGDVVLVKVWLRTKGVAHLEGLERRIQDALAPLGLV